MKRLGMVLVAATLAITGCGNTETTGSPTPAAPGISAGRAEAIWLKSFLSVVEAHAAGEAKETLHSPGVEQHCASEEGAYHCKGVIPEEEGQFIPGHETNCIVAQMVIDHSGHIREESADPISQYREAFHTEVECHL